MDLNKKFEELKKYSSEKELERINNHIYNLELTDKYLSKLSENILIYIHVKLHNAMDYKKPFAPKDKIKIAHDKVAKIMQKHPIIDELDKNFRNV